MTERRDHGFDDPFEAALARRLRESADGLDGATRSRLNRARQAALAGWPRRPRAAAFPAWSAVAATVAAVALVGLWQGRGGPGLELEAEPRATAPTMPGDLEILLADEDLAMLEELDFYVWLDALDEAGGAA